MIKISVPNDDHVALRAMAKALEEIAVARGAPAQSVSYPKFFKECASQVIDEAVRNGSISKKPEVDTTSQQVESLATHVITSQEKVGDPIYLGDGNFSQGYRIEIEELPTTDSTGTPWDERIHSASKALNGDGTWRLRRKPKDMDEGEWSVFVQNVQDELKWDSRQLGASEEHVVIATSPSDELDEALEEYDELVNVTPEGDDFHVDAGVVTEQQVASFPPPPPVPVPAPPVVEESTAPFGHEHAHMTFPQVMAFLTERHGRITSAQVDQIIADMGLEKITDLNTQPEHTGPFIARVKALLGE